MFKIQIPYSVSEFRVKWPLKNAVEHEYLGLENQIYFYKILLGPSRISSMKVRKTERKPSVYTSNTFNRSMLMLSKG